jgi:hypothetical protein
VPSQCPSPGQVPRGILETVGAGATATAAAGVEGDVEGSVAGTISGLTTAASLGVEDGADEVRRFIPGGRGACLAFSYNPQALQMILPLMSRRHKGVEVVPQLLKIRLATRQIGILRA